MIGDCIDLNKEIYKLPLWRILMMETVSTSTSTEETEKEKRPEEGDSWGWYHSGGCWYTSTHQARGRQLKTLQKSFYELFEKIRVFGVKASCRSLWEFRRVLRVFESFMRFCEFSRVFMSFASFPEFLWVFMRFREFSWVFMSFHYRRVEKEYEAFWWLVT